MAGVFATLLQMIGVADATGKLFIPEAVLRDFWMDGKPPLTPDGAIALWGAGSRTGLGSAEQSRRVARRC